MITISNADKALKDYYLDAVTSQLNNNISPFYSAIEKNTTSVYGKSTKVLVCAGFGGNIKAGAEDDVLPASSRNQYYEIVLPLKNLYGTIEISDKALRASNAQGDGFINLLNAEMEGLISSAKDSFERMLFGDGSGKLGTVKRKVDNNTYELYSVKNFRMGQCVDFYFTGNAAPDLQNVVTVVDYDKKEIELLRPITSSTLGTFYAAGSRFKELTGLEALFGQPELYNYHTGEDTYFEGYEMDGDGTLIAQEIQYRIDEVEEIYGKRPNLIIASFNTKNQIANNLKEYMYTPGVVQLEGGYTTVSIGGVPVVAARYCPENTCYILNTDDFKLVQLCDWEWIEDESGNVLKQVPGKPAYTATLVKYAELVCTKPCAQTKYTW